MAISTQSATIEGNQYRKHDALGDPLVWLGWREPLREKAEERTKEQAQYEGPCDGLKQVPSWPSTTADEAGNDKLPAVQS